MRNEESLRAWVQKPANNTQIKKRTNHLSPPPQKGGLGCNLHFRPSPWRLLSSPGGYREGTLPRHQRNCQNSERKWKGNFPFCFRKRLQGKCAKLQCENKEKHHWVSTTLDISTVIFEWLLGRMRVCVLGIIALKCRAHWSEQTRELAQKGHCLRRHSPGGVTSQGVPSKKVGDIHNR